MTDRLPVGASPPPQKLIGVLALVVWLHLVWGMYPLPPQAALDFQASLNQPPDPAVENAFWVQWVKNLFFLVAGVAVAIFAYRGVRYWKLAIVATSGFMALPAAYYIASDIVDRGGFGDWWSLWVAVVNRFLSRGEVWSILTKLYWLFVWPIYHVLLMAAVALIFFFNRKSPHAVRRRA